MNQFRNFLTFTLILAVGSVLIDRSAGQGGPGGPGGQAGQAGQAGPPAGPAPVTLKPVTTAQAVPDATGFIPRWVLLEPIPINGQVTESASRATIKTEYFANQLTIVPHDGDKVTVNGAELAWHAVDTIHFNVNLYHFAHALNKSSDNMLFWAVTVVNCPQDMPNVRLAIGSNSSSVWWVNGQEVAGVYGDIQTTMDDAVSKRLTLKKGPNVVRCAVVNNRGATDFCARFLDAEGKPVRNLTLTVGDAAR
jgi:hypothetical protein